MQMGEVKLRNYTDKAAGKWYVTWLRNYMRMTYDFVWIPTVYFPLRGSLTILSITMIKQQFDPSKLMGMDYWQSDTDRRKPKY
jgi:hypothetical protein